MPVVSDYCGVDFVPSRICKVHCLKLIHIIDLCGCYAFIIVVNCLLDESDMIVSVTNSFLLDQHEYA
jgi:hypothetical protein